MEGEIIRVAKDGLDVSDDAEAIGRLLIRICADIETDATLQAR